MKAHVQTIQEKLSLLECDEIMRINKIWMLVLNQEFGFAQGRLTKAFNAVCDISGKLYEDPEYWYKVDELLIDQQGINMKPEDLNEREKIALEIHKKSGKKWRSY